MAERNDIYNRIKKLRKLIEYHQTLYHTFDTPELSDEAFDALRRELEQLENEYPEDIKTPSPTQVVGGKMLEKFEKMAHETPMLSLNDGFSEKDIEEWYERVEKYLTSNGATLSSASFYCELKIDGLAVELIYEDGVLTHGITRGDGFVGENITENIRMVSDVPKKIEPLGTWPIPKRLVVRGEIFITKEKLIEANKEQEKRGLKAYANTRNLAAGSLRQLDPSIVALRGLSIFHYDVVYATDTSFDNHEEKHKALASWGFAVNKENRKVNALKDVYALRDRWNKQREKLPYEVDGIVVIINENNLFEIAGVVGKAPRGAIAYKFSPREATTRVKKIKVQVGRTGVLTPVAELEPVAVGGVIISHATLHNEDEIKRLGLKIGDTVVVRRAGDVIPKITKVLQELRTGNETVFAMPKKCPVDGAPVVREGALIRCGNEMCGARHRESLYHFVSRGAFDIRGLGPKVIDRFLDEGLISDATDIFFLKKGDIEMLERFGEKSADNIVSEIDSKKITTPERFFFSLGILHIGEETAYVLGEIVKRDSKKMKKPSDLWTYFSKFSREDFEKIYDIGPKVSESLTDWFSKEKNKEFLYRLDDAGVSFLIEKKNDTSLHGKVFVLTGTLSSLERNEAKKIIRSYGGEVSEAVSKKTSFVVVGENPGSKMVKAQKIGVPILSEDEFLLMIKKSH